MLFITGLFQNYVFIHPPYVVPSDFDVGDAFSSTNTSGYIIASPDYFPALPGNTSPDFLEHLSKDLLASLTISPFHDDLYMKIMQAYNAISNESHIPPQALIAPPIVLPSSLVLSPSPYNSRDFFLPEEIQPPQKISMFPNFLLYNSFCSHIYLRRERSHKTPLERHEEQSRLFKPLNKLLS
ncbi:hypothetical protein Tco_0369559 [Tanacetum coccineum]